MLNVGVSFNGIFWSRADFQNYLRTQTGNNTTVNIIISTVDYLLRVQVPAARTHSGRRAAQLDNTAGSRVRLAGRGVFGSWLVGCFTSDQLWEQGPPLSLRL